jgi:LuxR family maltose regulon positive regulatory protein
LSDILYAQGDLELCIQLCEQVMAEAVGDESMLDDQGNARLNLSHVAYEQNDLETATRYAAEALDLGRRRANELLQAQAAGRLALIHAGQGALIRARDELKALMVQMKSPLALGEIRTVEALLAVRAGEAPGAWLASSHEALATHKERETFILARWRIVEGQPAGALALLQPVLVEAVAHGRVRSQVEALCLAALATGDLSAAAEALAIGYEKGFRRLFLDEGARMAALLREILPALNKPGLRLYATTLLHLFSPDAVSVSQDAAGSLALVEPLSQQEIRVLKLLVAGLSNGEIARELVVSTNTIKTHVKSIYRKLNIGSREEARVVVKELKLL